MPNSGQQGPKRHRHRRGRRADIPLVLDVAPALPEPEVGLKALLAGAPLEGIDLRRDPAPGRSVEP